MVRISESTIELAAAAGGAAARRGEVREGAARRQPVVLLDKLERETSDYVEESQAGARKRRTALHPLTVVRLTLERLLRTDAKLAMLLTVGGSPTPRVAAGTLRLTRAMLRLSRAMMFLRSRTVVIRHRVFFYMQMF
eukprot:COSAG02_NODE_22176_length_761_cov_0.897281_1_plen_137_part_00